MGEPDLLRSDVGTETADLNSEMIDLLYLSHNRLEFTRESLPILLRNTNLTMVRRLLLYDDASEDGTREYVESVAGQFSRAKVITGRFGSPVAVMNHYLSDLNPEANVVFAKIDSDTMVPPGWLEESAAVFSKFPEIDCLGIEAFNRVVNRQPVRGYRQSEFVGGIGLFRNRAFITLPRPNERFGFTAWQQKSQWVKTGWIDPSLPVFLLDRLPMEPWRSLSQEYVKKGWQRDWGPYGEKDSALWAWWPGALPSAGK